MPAELLWTSNKIYVHPLEQRKDTVGRVSLSTSGVYYLKVGSKVVSCPQEWAAMIHEAEESEGTT